ncbi:GIY-YIG nuclease family protein [Candidatus Avelusimicrobium alvi]|uniref:GIY-YIG nuclease family protein n=1 Tax=Candidatus Avelusimicrobium alvi TaxID=3416221 RepID=UPI003D0AA46D
MGIITKKLQNVSVAAVEDFSPILLDCVGEDQGIYVLYKGAKLYYIGRAVNLQKRLAQHLRDRHQKKWDKFSLFVVSDEKHIGDLESLLIDICEPTGNRSHPKTEVKDLKKEFEDRIDAFHADEKALLLGEKPICKKQKMISLQRIYKGKKYTAAFDCKQHTVLYNKVLYSSPSAAARAVVKHSANGLLFWKGTDKKGKLVPLKKLI